MLIIFRWKVFRRNPIKCELRSDQSVLIHRQLKKHLIQDKMKSRLSFSNDSDDGKKKNMRELKVLFVSKRDSCRGPMAETIFDHIAEKNKIKPFNRFLWRASSAGMVKYNQGYLPEQLCLRVLAENNLDTMHGCRQVSDFMTLSSDRSFIR